jgi:hypothetical protein
MTCPKCNDTGMKPVPFEQPEPQPGVIAEIEGMWSTCDCGAVPDLSGFQRDLMWRNGIQSINAAPSPSPDQSA